MYNLIITLASLLWKRSKGEEMATSAMVGLALLLVALAIAAIVMFSKYPYIWSKYTAIVQRGTSTGP
jgi:hypothetical protein